MSRLTLSLAPDRTRIGVRAGVAPDTLDIDTDYQGELSP
jgi:hypothetical protein